MTERVEQVAMSIDEDLDRLKAQRDAEEIQRGRELADLSAVMATPEGRRFMWRLIGHCKTFETIFEPSSKIYYNAGRQDVGHFLLVEIWAADPSQAQYLEMQNEAMKGGM